MAILALNSIKSSLKWKILTSRRTTVTIMSSIGVLIMSVINISLSVAIVAMTTERNVTLDDGTEVFEKEFNWNSKEQGLVLSAYYYGYIWTQLLGGILASKFGGHIVFSIGNVASGILMLLSPTMAKLGIYHFIAVRIAIGLFSGVTLPAVLEMISKWAPIYERTTILGVILLGMQCGTVTGFLSSGYFAKYLGWQSIFSIFGCLGIVWFIVWMIYIREDPASDPRISPAERNYIEANLENPTTRNLKTPWKAIATSPAVYAIVIGNFCDLWSRLTFLTEIPKFLSDVIGYDLETTGMLAASPYILSIVVSLTASPLSDYLRSKNILSTQNVRKLGTSIGFLVTGLFLTLIANLSNGAAILACLIIAIGVSSVTLISCMANPLDIAPSYAAIVTGIGETISIIPGLVSPIFTGFVVKNGHQDEWKIIFYTSAGFCIFGMVFFAIFAKGEVQEWAKMPTTNAKEAEDGQKTSKSC